MSHPASFNQINFLSFYFYVLYLIGIYIVEHICTFYPQFTATFYTIITNKQSSIMELIIEVLNIILKYKMYLRRRNLFQKLQIYVKLFQSYSIHLYLRKISETNRIHKRNKRQGFKSSKGSYFMYQIYEIKSKSLFPFLSSLRLQDYYCLSHPSYFLKWKRSELE